MSLYNKYRPTTLEGLSGNVDLVSTLKNLLSKPKPPHAYLLTGETGCGKTTTARIIADMLGCKGTDFKEINASDFRGIDMIREIISNAKYKPLEGKCRMWLIDESHKLTGDAQNAMLKLLEDPPEHAYFILATTDPQKLISTVKGRCSVFNLQTLSDKDMYRLLKRITVAEKEVVEKEIFDQIIQDALGHARNAINVLEQVLSVEPEKRMEVAKRKAEEQNEIIELCRALLKNASWKEISEILKGLKTQDAESIRRVVLGYAQSILLSGQDNPLCGLILEEFLENTYDSGFPRIVYAAYSVVKNRE